MQNFINDKSLKKQHKSRLKINILIEKIKYFLNKTIKNLLGT